MDGYGVILRIDLSNEEISKEPVTPKMVRKYIGGEGINTHLVWEHFLKVDPKIDPVDPQNVLVWGMGPLGGTSYGGGSKSKWTFKGPAYNMFADSTSGGGFGCHMRWAGYDHLVITGRARHPIYIRIDNDNVELRDASHLWDKIASETEEDIKEELGDSEVEIACIGPAGANMVTYSSITVSGHRSAGRAGGGCVFGSKNLKAIVAKGSKGISVYDRRAFFRAMDALQVAIEQGPEWRKSFEKYGTLSLVAPCDASGATAFRNQQETPNPETDKLGGQWFFDHMHQRPISCSPGCSHCCQAWYYIKGDESPQAMRYAGEHGHRLEYGMIGPLGASCDISDLPTVAHFAGLCQEYSMDCFEAGMSISFLMELWQRGIVTGEDMARWTGEPLSLKWGDSDTVEKLLETIALQKNQLGEILRGGVYQAAKKIEELKGVPVLQYAVYGKGGATHQNTVKSQPGWALLGAVSPIGCHHSHGLGVDTKTSMEYFGKPDAGLLPTKDADYSGSPTLKGAGHALSEYFSSITNSLGVCKFGGGGAPECCCLSSRTLYVRSRCY